MFLSILNTFYNVLYVRTQKICEEKFMSRILKFLNGDLRQQSLLQLNLKKWKGFFEKETVVGFRNV